MSDRPYLVGYASLISGQPGDRLEVMLSADPPTPARVDLVTMGKGEPTGCVSERVVADLGPVQVPYQPTVAGSCVVVTGADREWPAAPFVAHALVMPTRLGLRQALLSQTTGPLGWCLGLLASGVPVAAATWPAGRAEAVGAEPLVAGAWYLVAAGFSASTGLRVVAWPLPPTASWWTAPSAAVRRSEGGREGRIGIDGLLPAPLYMAARVAQPGRGWTEAFDGKMESPGLSSGLLDPELLDALYSGARLTRRSLVAWDFAANIADGGVASLPVTASGGAGLDGTCLNSPARAVTGHSWDGSDQDYRRAAGHYGAVHFHSDDLDDCRWQPTVDAQLPDDLASGAYAVRVDAGGGRVDRIPVFVRPRRPGAAPLLVLVPTASYLAYANDHPASDGRLAQAVASKTPVLLEGDMLLHEHREWGLSCYDRHADGSGVCYSSRLRPLMNMRPTHRYHVGAWQLPADLALVSWLADRGVACEFATDEDLHSEGASLLSPYRVVLTGSHPEYYSTRMLDAVESWVGGGGRLVYIGANGFYWRVAFDPERPWVMEVRRGHAGSRAWESAPGETHLAFTGEQGGLWRHLGRAPQKLAGVGYAAQGFDQSGWYRRLPDSWDPRAGFIFDGVQGETFGHAGSLGGGAVGQEIDRYDRSLGTAHDALLLATSEGLTDGYLRCAEEVTFTVPGLSAVLDPQARADMVYLVNPAGGAVFATGSIAWAAALDGDADVARITENVLTRFCDPLPLDWTG